MERLGRGIGVACGIIATATSAHFLWTVGASGGGAYLLIWLQPISGLAAIWISLTVQYRLLYLLAALSFVAMGWYLLLLLLWPYGLIGAAPFGYVLAAILIDQGRG